MVNDGRSCGVVYRIISRLFPIVLSWTYHIVVLESRDAPDWTALLAFESGQDTHVERGGGLHVLILLDARRVITILLYSPMLVLEVIRFSSRGLFPVNVAHGFLIVVTVLERVHHLMMLKEILSVIIKFNLALTELKSLEITIL